MKGHLITKADGRAYIKNEFGNTLPVIIKSVDFRTAVTGNRITRKKRTLQVWTRHSVQDDFTLQLGIALNDIEAIMKGEIK